MLKHHIPIKTDHWDVTEPGFTEVDLVSHSGDRADKAFYNRLARDGFAVFMHGMLARLIDRLRVQRSRRTATRPSRDSPTS